MVGEAGRALFLTLTSTTSESLSSSTTKLLPLSLASSSSSSLSLPSADDPAKSSSESSPPSLEALRSLSFRLFFLRITRGAISLSSSLVEMRLLPMPEGRTPGGDLFPPSSSSSASYSLSSLGPFPVPFPASSSSSSSSSTPSS